MNSRGFTLVELLVATVVVLLLAGAAVTAATQARAVFDRVPASIDMQQRGTAAIETLSQALRSAVRVTADLPEDDGGYAQLTTVTPIANPAHGVLAAGQVTAAGSMTLAAAPCPSVKDVCGFTAGAVAMIEDGDGFDVFIVGSTNAPLRRLMPLHALSRPYGAGSTLLEVEQLTYGLDEQADGTYSLTRVTAGGAVQPVVDALRSLSFDVDGRRVDVRFVVQAPTELLQRAVADRAFAASITVRSTP